MATQFLLILLCLAVGLIFGKKGFLDGSTAPALVRLTVDAALPCALFSTMLERFGSGALAQAGRYLAIPFASILLLFLFSYLAARLLRVPAGRRGVFMAASSTSNTIFLGLPVSLALLGPEGLPGALMFYIANTSLFWSVGLSAIRRDASPPEGRPAEAAVVSWLKALASPPLAALVLALLFVFAGLSPPEPLASALSSFGAIATPLALVYMGYSLSRLEKTDLVLDRSLLGLVFFRAIASPLLVLGLSRLFGLFSGESVPRVLEAAFLIQASMPVMSQSPIVAKREGADEAFAARAAGLSLLLCPVPLALAMMLY